MSIYIESNFVLELALMQEQHESCEDILKICEAGKAQLVLPAFSIAEPYQALIGRDKKRKQLTKNLTDELQQISRSKPYSENKDVFQSITSLLAQSIIEDESRLRQTIDRLLKIAEIIPLTSAILKKSLEYQITKKLSPQDSIVYASTAFFRLMRYE